MVVVREKATMVVAVQSVPLRRLANKWNHRRMLDYVVIQQRTDELSRTSDQMQFRWSL